MAEERIILSGLWLARVLTHLLGDVLRVFAGAFTAGEMQGRQATQTMRLLAALVMLIPIMMVVLSLTSTYPTIRRLNVGTAIFLVIFNLVGLPYPSTYDNFLIVFGFAFNALIVRYAWTRA